jgi:hypothetical protein
VLWFLDGAESLPEMEGPHKWSHYSWSPR